MAVTDVYDATTGNVQHLPPGLAAGYDSGPGVAWTAGQWAAHPGALHIYQRPVAGGVTADWIDGELYAATPAECAAWKPQADAARKAGTRKGQREPGIYCSRSAMTSYVNALAAAGVRYCPFWIAAYPALPLSDARALAIAEVQAASGPYPVVGRQYADLGTYDASVFRDDWLATGGTAPPPPPSWTEALMAELPTLAQGATGPDVRSVQGLLTARGHMTAVDGTYGPVTKGQVALLQHAAGLFADGVVGPATWPKLLNR